jgi:nitroreductase
VVGSGRLTRLLATLNVTKETSDDENRPHSWGTVMDACWTTTQLSTQLTGCLEAAIAAPSVHNSQPWRFGVGHNRIDVICDVSRRLRAIDPHGREAMISVGAAVLNLRIAILAAGRIPLVRLRPDLGDPDLAARVIIGGPHRPDATIRALASAIARRRTNRRPFRDIEVRDEVTDQLVAAARAEGATLAVADPLGREAILGLVRSANDRQRDRPAYREELVAWTDGDASRRDGILTCSFGPADDTEVLPLRDFGLAHPDVPRRQARFEAAPTIVVLYTAADGPADWLRAGQAMQRVLLTATVRGVSNTPMTAPTELPELRDLLTDVNDGRVAQLILRLGYGDPCPATPRRPLADVVEMTAAVTSGY